MLCEALPVPAGWLAFAALELWPWKAWAAASEIAPVAATEPAISHRLILEISASPASRALTDRDVMRVSLGCAPKLYVREQ